jgi:hypothetical protein
MTHTAEHRKRRAPVTAGAVLIAVALWAAMLGGLAWALPSDGRRVVALMAVAFVLALLMNWFPRLGRAVTAAAPGYFTFALWMIAALAPATVAFAVARRLEASTAVWLQVFAFTLWACMLAVAISFLITGSRRSRLFDGLRHVGAFAPLAYSSSVLLIAAAFFGGLTTVLVSRGYISIDGNPQRAIDFYMWHFLDAVPVFKINETLLWDRPFTYRDSNVGLLLLIFKVTVIAPVIAAFTGYWAYAQRTGRSTPAARERIL